MPRRRKHYWAKVLRKTTVLPITFLGSGRTGDGGDCGSDRIGGGVAGVLSDMSGCCGVTGGTGRSSGRSVGSVTGGGVGGKCGGARRARR